MYCFSSPTFEGFLIHAPVNDQSFDNGSEIKIFPGLRGVVAIEVWAFNANALGDMHISYYKINASKNLPEVK